MAHLIEIGQDGTAAFVSANTPAWHRLGTVAPGPMTTTEALKLARLDNWNVSMEPLMALPTGTICVECSAVLDSQHDDMCSVGDHEGLDDTRTVTKDDCVNPVMVPHHRAVVRTNPFTGKRETLSVGGLEYTPIQNETMAETLQAILDESGAIVDTAGSLRDGLDTFVTARMPEGILVGGVDAVELHLAGFNYFQPGKSSEFLITPVRVVCANTQAAALGNHKSRWAVRHSPNAPARILEAREALKLSFDYRDAFADEAEKMLKEQLTIREFEKVCREIWPQPAGEAPPVVKERDDALMGTLKKLFRGDTNANIIKGKTGTHWAGYQTIVEYIDHHAAIIGGGEDSARIRAERALLGKDAPERKQKAFKLLQVA
ncbi:DUF932 domain-containing protein [Actinokineospora iranica]|uniref:Phage/plasmid-like protein TIGR03299 n=1 Tax=Actinokineospora iranica TaxID=1271860 RepID=A0A1G6K428_9PSEU|nr:DUF932 domain-containing protein [Actinokineospora iranica]SDC25385.1 phage/plasmid-like protein TIGR03299 [Actinokineospora iranica]